MRPLLALLLIGPTSLAEDPGTTPTPPAPAPPASAPAPLPAAIAATGEQVLDEAIARLALGDYTEALAIAIRAQAQYPDLAVSFESIAGLAVDQLERQRQGAAAPAQSAPSPAPSRPPGFSRLPPPRSYGAMPSRSAPRRTTRALAGFEIGTPTGFRAEIDLGAKRNGSVTAIGLRVGGNALSYNGQWPVADVTLYMDFRAAEKWRIEGLVGGFSYFGWVYPETGVAVRYDPKGPLLATLGGRIGPYGSLLPDASVGFVW